MALHEKEKEARAECDFMVTKDGVMVATHDPGKNYEPCQDSKIPLYRHSRMWKRDGNITPRCQEMSPRCGNIGRIIENTIRRDIFGHKEFRTKV